MRRYDAMPAIKKAELVEGVVYVPSPVRQKYHGCAAFAPGGLAGYLSRRARRASRLATTAPFFSTSTMPPNPTPSFSSSPNTAAGSRSTKMAILKVVPTWSLRSQRAVPVTIYTTSSIPIVAMVSGNMLFTACWTSKSTGSF